MSFVSVFGSILPSLITIFSNGLTVCRIRQLNPLTLIVPCRRRTADTRRVLVVITVECLFAIVNCWFSNILISIIYCKGTLLAEDDCPKYLKSNYALLVLFDMFNSISNLILHCLCEKHFRHEFYRIFQYWYELFQGIFTTICCYYFKISSCRRTEEQSNIGYEVSVTDRANSSSSSDGHVYLTIHRSSRNSTCDDDQSYSFFRVLQRKDRVSTFVRYHLLIKRSSNSRRNSTVLHPPEQPMNTSS